jgi:OOP family OmpA-OmpF porin
MSRASRATISVGDTLSHLMAYSEAVEGPPAPPPPVMARQSGLSTPVLELPPVATPAAAPTSIAAQTPAPPRNRVPPPAAAATPQFVSNDKLVVLRGVFFEKNSSDLDDLDELILDDAVRTLKKRPDIRVYVKGYSDSHGSPRLNQKLSQERAASVAAYLVSNGVPLSQLIVLGMGSSHPVASNDTAAGRALNRRVELEPVIQ